MKVLLNLLLGCSDIGIPVQNVKDILNYCNKNRIILLKLRAQEDRAVFRIYMRDESVVMRYLEEVCIAGQLLKRKGIPMLWRTYRHRVGLLSGIVLFFAALFVAPMFLWEINIAGLDRLNGEYVTELLRKEGVYVGAFSPAIDRQTVCTNILRSGADISWLSVNIRGSSANVEILEREFVSTAKHMADGANIVAKKSGVVTDVQVQSGRAVVKKGETVQVGALLVSGVYDTKKMGTRYVYSEGSVYAAVCDEFCIEVPLSNTGRVYGEEKVKELSIKMFGKSINIFKNYSILSEKYDTIQREDSLPFYRLGELPISIETVCALPFEDVPVRLSEEEALRRARRELQRQMRDGREYLETLSLEEKYTVENDILIYRCFVEAIENIAAVSEFCME